MVSATPQHDQAAILRLTYRCSRKLDGPYDSRVLPVVLTVIMMTFLTIVWIGSIISFKQGA